MLWSDQVELAVEWGARGQSVVDEAAWDIDIWDGAPGWAGSEPQWEPLDQCELRALTTTRGRSFATEGFGVGTATLVLVLSEQEAGGPVPAEEWSWRTHITLGTELRVRATHLGTGLTWPIYRGDVRAVRDGWSPFGVHLLTINLAELTGRLGRIDLPEREPTGAGDRSGERMARIAALAQIPVSRRRIDPGLMILQATNFARNLAGEAEVTTASEGGDFFTSRDGAFTFRQRAWWMTDPRASTVRQVWANTPVPDAAGAPVGCPVDVETRLDVELVANVISLSRAGGTAQTARATDSMSLYGPITYARSDLLNVSDDDVASLAAWRAAETGHRTRVIDGITLNPVGDPQSWPGVLDVELGDLHRLYWDDGEEVTDLAVHIQGVSHKVTPDSWETSLLVWDRYGYTPADGWDVDNWDEALWAEPLVSA